jgi:hypothetical protein
LTLASGLPESAIRSFAADFAGGRPILIRDDAIQFRDEPTETWFRERFAPTKDQWAEVADRLSPSAETDIRDNPGIMARARSLALNIMRKNGIANIALALWNGALSLDHSLEYKAI